MSKDVPAVSTAVRILERLGADWPATMSPGRLVRDLELNRSTCYNILATLQRSGWAATVGGRAGWTLGPRLLVLAGASQTLITKVVQEEIDELSRQLGFVVFAAERDGSGGYTVVIKADHQNGVRVTVGIGDRFPFSAPALMQAFHAWTDPDEFEHMLDRQPLERFTKHTVTDATELRKVLAEVRRDGFSRSILQFDMGQGATAAAIFDANCRPSFALCTLAFSSHLNESNVEAVGTQIKAAAERVTRRSGGQLPPDYGPGGLVRGTA